MYHAQNGWHFERLQDGSVRIVHMHGDRVLEEQILTPFTWASIVASVSLRNENGCTYQDALDFHMRPNP